jgi:hemerythrin-like domain-containing protein
MQAVVTLLDDHHYIGGMLDVLDACARHLHAGEPLDAGMAAGVRQYFEQFAPTHERKEEQRLFEHLERHVGADDRQLLSVLRAEHRVLETLRAALVPHIRATGSPELSTLARAYAARKREHMHLEDALFHKALHVPDDGLGEALAAVEREGLGPTGREWYIQLALDYTDIVATWHPDVRHPEFSARTAAMRQRAERGLGRSEPRRR